MTGLTAAMEQDNRFAARITADVTDEVYASVGRKYFGGQRTRRTFSTGHRHDLPAPDRYTVPNANIAKTRRPVVYLSIGAGMRILSDS
jgi:hypothetical protein